MNAIKSKVSVIWAGLAIFLVGVLWTSSVADGQPNTGGPTISVRGPNEAVVGRRFTLEVLIANPSATALKDLEFLAETDAHLEQESKAREHRATVEVAAEDLAIVRLPLTPRKKGQAGVDITLRTKSGATQRIRHMWPVLAAEDAPETILPAGTHPLKATISSPKENLVGRTGLYLIHVQNLDTKASADNQPLLVACTSAPGLSRVSIAPKNSHKMLLEIADHPKLHANGETPHVFTRGLETSAVPTNPVRLTKISLPSLQPGDGRTFPVRLTPKRIGDFVVSVHVESGARSGDNASVGSAMVRVTFDDKAAIDTLLPTAADAAVTPRLVDKLTDVPEVAFESRLAKTLPGNEAFEHLAHTIEKISHVNAKKTDAYLAALIGKRADLAGLPFTMGDACRLPATRGAHFLRELSSLRMAMAQSGPHGQDLAKRLTAPTTDAKSDVDSARVAALVQVVIPEKNHHRQEMAKYLMGVSHNDSSRALANLAIFAEEDKVRADAITALNLRADKNYTDILVNGLNYPWPAVAQRTTEAIVKLKRTDLLPQLADMLERPDPRAPQTREVAGKNVPVLREVVRVNHLRNCLLCHAPQDPNTPVIHPRDSRGSGFGRGEVALVAQIPIANQPLPVTPPSGGYGQFSVPDNLVRFDVTYLRQDFSLMLPVADHAPWPASQRFDFLVRTRTVSETDAQTYRDLLRTTKAGELSPYSRAAVTALRDLTGRDAAPTAAAWREVLEAIKSEAN